MRKLNYRLKQCRNTVKTSTPRGAGREKRSAPLATQYFIAKSEINSKLEFKNQEIRLKYDKIVQKYRDAFDKIAYYADDINISEVITHVKQNLGNKVFKLDFIEFGRQFANTKGQGSGDNYRIALNSLLRFNNGHSLDINELTASFLDKYIRWCLTDNGGKTSYQQGVEHPLNKPMVWIWVGGDMACIGPWWRSYGIVTGTD